MWSTNRTNSRYKFESRIVIDKSYEFSIQIRVENRDRQIVRIFDTKSKMKKIKRTWIDRSKKKIRQNRLIFLSTNFDVFESRTISIDCCENLTRSFFYETRCDCVERNRTIAQKFHDNNSFTVEFDHFSHDVENEKNEIENVHRKTHREQIRKTFIKFINRSIFSSKFDLTWQFHIRTIVASRFIYHNTFIQARTRHVFDRTISKTIDCEKSISSRSFRRHTIRKHFDRSIIWFFQKRYILDRSKIIY